MCFSFLSCFSRTDLNSNECEVKSAIIRFAVVSTIRARIFRALSRARFSSKCAYLSPYRMTLLTFDPKFSIFRQKRGR